tara:strand:+ start:4191 stop:4775 length:585 start_codon:yes stop_codon:yes gene_type:complete
MKRTLAKLLLSTAIIASSGNLNSCATLPPAPPKVEKVELTSENIHEQIKNEVINKYIENYLAITTIPEEIASKKTIRSTLQKLETIAMSQDSLDEKENRFINYLTVFFSGVDWEKTRPEARALLKQKGDFYSLLGKQMRIKLTSEEVGPQYDATKSYLDSVVDSITFEPAKIPAIGYLFFESFNLDAAYQSLAN